MMEMAELIETKHGIINRETLRYTTRRKKEHYFIKFGGFAISESELEKAEMYNCNWIIIRYYGKTGIKIYRFDIRDYLNGEQYNFGDDIQRALPLDKGEFVGEEMYNNVVSCW